MIIVNIFTAKQNIRIIHASVPITAWELLWESAKTDWLTHTPPFAYSIYSQPPTTVRPAHARAHHRLWLVSDWVGGFWLVRLVNDRWRKERRERWETMIDKINKSKTRVSPQRVLPQEGRCGPPSERCTSLQWDSIQSIEYRTRQRRSSDIRCCKREKLHPAPAASLRERKPEWRERRRERTERGQDRKAHPQRQRQRNLSRERSELRILSIHIWERGGVQKANKQVIHNLWMALLLWLPHSWLFFLKPLPQYSCFTIPHSNPCVHTSRAQDLSSTQWSVHVVPSKRQPAALERGNTAWEEETVRRICQKRKTWLQI